MVKEFSYFRVLFRGKKDRRFKTLYIQTQILRTGFMAFDSASSIYGFGERPSFYFGADTSLNRRLVRKI